MIGNDQVSASALDRSQRFECGFGFIDPAILSGEYSMIKAAAQNGWIDEAKATLETLTSIKRAGADLIITYHALDAAKWLK